MRVDDQKAAPKKTRAKKKKKDFNGDESLTTSSSGDSNSNDSGDGKNDTISRSVDSGNVAHGSTETASASLGTSAGGTANTSSDATEMETNTSTTVVQQKKIKIKRGPQSIQDRLPSSNTGNLELLSQFMPSKKPRKAKERKTERKKKDSEDNEIEEPAERKGRDPKFMFKSIDNIHVPYRPQDPRTTRPFTLNQEGSIAKLDDPVTPLKHIGEMVQAPTRIVVQDSIRKTVWKYIWIRLDNYCFTLGKNACEMPRGCRCSGNVKSAWMSLISNCTNVPKDVLDSLPKDDMFRAEIPVTLPKKGKDANTDKTSTPAPAKEDATTEKEDAVVETSETSAVQEDAAPEKETSKTSAVSEDTVDEDSVPEDNVPGGSVENTTSDPLNPVYPAFDSMPDVVKKMLDPVIALVVDIRNKDELATDTEDWARIVLELCGLAFPSKDTAGLDYLFPIQTQKNSMPGLRYIRVCPSFIMELVGMIRRMPNNCLCESSYRANLHWRKVMSPMKVYTNKQAHMRQLTAGSLEKNGWEFLTPFQREEIYGNGVPEIIRHMHTRVYLRHSFAKTFWNQQVLLVMSVLISKTGYTLSKNEFPTLQMIVESFRHMFGPVHPSQSYIEHAYNKVSSAILLAKDDREYAPCDIFVVASHESYYEPKIRPEDHHRCNTDFPTKTGLQLYYAGDRHKFDRDKTTVPDKTLANRKLVDKETRKNKSDWQKMKEDKILYSSYPTAPTLSLIPETVYTLDKKHPEVQGYRTNARRQRLICASLKNLSFSVDEDGYKVLYGKEPTQNIVDAMEYGFHRVKFSCETAVFPVPENIPIEKLLNGFVGTYGCTPRTMVQKGFVREGGNDNVFRHEEDFTMEKLLLKLAADSSDGEERETAEKSFRGLLLEAFKKTTGLSHREDGVQIQYSLHLRCTTTDMQKREVSCKRHIPSLQDIEDKGLHSICCVVPIKPTGLLTNLYLGNVTSSSKSMNSSLVHVLEGSMLVFPSECLVSEGLMTIAGSCPYLFVMVWCQKQNPSSPPGPGPSIASDHKAYFGENGPFAASMSDEDIDKWRGIMKKVRSSETMTTLRARSAADAVCPSVIPVRNKTFGSASCGCMPDDNPQINKVIRNYSDCLMYGAPHCDLSLDELTPIPAKNPFLGSKAPKPIEMKNKVDENQQERRRRKKGRSQRQRWRRKKGRNRRATEEEANAK